MSQYSTNIGRLDATTSDFLSKEKEYIDCLEELNNLINHLGQSWNSPAYSQYKEMFLKKYSSLKQGQSIMEEFRIKLKTTRNNYVIGRNNILSRLR